MEEYTRKAQIERKKGIRGDEATEGEEGRLQVSKEELPQKTRGHQEQNWKKWEQQEGESQRHGEAAWLKGRRGARQDKKEEMGKDPHKMIL